MKRDHPFKTSICNCLVGLLWSPQWNIHGDSMRRSWSAKASYCSNSCSKSDLNHLIFSMSTTRSLESWESCPTDVTDDAGVDCESLNYHLWFIMWMQLIMQVRGSTVRHKNNSFWILESGLIAKLTTQMASPIDVWTLNREIAARILNLDWKIPESMQSGALYTQ